MLRSIFWRMQSMLFILLMLFFIDNNYAQLKPYRYWVQFTDKDNNGYSIDSPQVYLSQRAIDRRERYQIPIDHTDLPITRAYIDTVLRYNAQLIHKSKWMNAIVIESTDTSIIDSLKQYRFVNAIDSVAYQNISNKRNKFKEEYHKNKQFFEDDYYGASYDQIEMVNGDLLHQSGYRGEGMVMAIIDNGFTGVDRIDAYEKARNEGRILGGYDFVQQGTVKPGFYSFVDIDSNVFRGGSHGSSVFSVIAAELPSTYVGTAPKASYWLFRTETGYEYRIEEDNWIAAAEFADSVGVDVINSSLGYNTFDLSSMNHPLSAMDGNTTRITRGADLAAKKGILVVVSAGNEGGGSWKKITAPADGDSVLTIGAVDSKGQITTFSSSGPSADGRVKPNIVAQGSGTAIINSSGNITSGRGTSLSSPLVAGLATCLWQAHPNKNNMEIMEALHRSASQYETPNDALGFGIPDFYCAHFLLMDSACQVTEVEETQVNLMVPFPNPFNHSFSLWLSLDNQYPLEIFVYDVVGGLVFQEVLTSDLDIDFEYTLSKAKHWASGLYFVKIIQNQQEHILRVVKQD